LRTYANTWTDNRDSFVMGVNFRNGATESRDDYSD